MNHEEREILADALEALKGNSELGDELICECNCIGLQEIREFLGKREPTIELMKELKLGSGCSSCLKNFKQWRDRI